MGKSCADNLKKQFFINLSRFCVVDLTKFGYKCNLLKIPNQTGRRYWNYVKISGDDDIAVGGVVPADAMEEINNIYRQGVTIWHDHANIGNYALDNTII